MEVVVFIVFRRLVDFKSFERAFEGVNCDFYLIWKLLLMGMLIFFVDLLDEVVVGKVENIDYFIEEIFGEFLWVKDCVKWVILICLVIFIV